MKYIRYSIPVVIIFLSAVMYLYPSFKIKAEEVRTKASEEVTNGYNSMPVHFDGGYIKPSGNSESDSTEMSREIEVTSEEIRKGDVDFLIGSNEPFNTRFITQEDVENSIKEILTKNGLTADIFDKEYMEYVVTLRHKEMKDSIPETKSSVLKIATEYNSKLGGIK